MINTNHIVWSWLTWAYSLKSWHLLPFFMWSTNVSRMALLIKTLLEWGLAFANDLGSGEECAGAFPKGNCMMWSSINKKIAALSLRRNKSVSWWSIGVLLEILFIHLGNMCLKKKKLKICQRDCAEVAKIWYLLSMKYCWFQVKSFCLIIFFN